MTVIHYDCFSGISGDMHLGAMIDLGVDPNYLIKELDKLGLPGYHLEIKRDQRKGITGTKVTVVMDKPTHHDHDHDHPHPHVHTNTGVSKASQPPPMSGNLSFSPQGHHHEPHRNLHDIEQILQNSTLGQPVIDRARRMFILIAQAEAKIHGKSLEEIHFHEVGAIDSIVDIVGAAICLEFFKPERVLCSPVQLGGGMVKCAHGTFPVPAPATAEILSNIPVKTGSVPFETTTPTGAAILAANVHEFGEQFAFTPSVTAYGIGHRDTSVPNVLRVMLGEISESRRPITHPSKTHLVIECNIDDMNPEIYEYLMEKLFQAGADDVSLIPVIMKKSRPGTILSTLCKPSLAEVIRDIILRETTTLGLREYPVEKYFMERETRSIQTKYGPIRVKVASIDGEAYKHKAEYEDCAEAARVNKIPIRLVYEEINRIIAPGLKS